MTCYLVHPQTCLMEASVNMEGLRPFGEVSSISSLPALCLEQGGAERPPCFIATCFQALGSVFSPLVGELLLASIGDFSATCLKGLPLAFLRYFL